MGKKESNPPPPYVAEKPIEELNIVKCPSCGGMHFRHTGNVITYRTFDRHDNKNVGEKSGDIDMNDHFVYVCVGCGKPWVSISANMYDLSEHIDVAKFDRVNKALQDDTKTDAHC